MAAVLRGGMVCSCGKSLVTFECKMHLASVYLHKVSKPTPLEPPYNLVWVQVLACYAVKIGEPLNTNEIN